MDNYSNQLESEIPDNVFLVLDKQLFPVDKATIRIGRHAENDLIINDPLISRWHAEIRFEDKDFVVYDMGSKFGTEVNNEPVLGCVLKSGDTISLANTPLLFIDRSDQVISRTQDTTGVLEDQES